MHSAAHGSLARVAFRGTMALTVEASPAVLPNQEEREDQMKIALTPDIEGPLVELASEQGTTAENLALEALRQRFAAPADRHDSGPSQGTLADFLREHIGALSSGEHVPGGGAMSESCGRKFAGGLRKKREAGAL